MNEKQLLLLTLDILKIPYEENLFQPFIYFDYNGEHYTVSFWNKASLNGQVSTSDENGNDFKVIWNRHNWKKGEYYEILQLTKHPKD